MQAVYNPWCAQNKSQQTTTHVAPYTPVHKLTHRQQKTLKVCVVSHAHATLLLRLRLA